MNASIEFLESLERSIDKVIESELINKKQSIGTRMLLIKVMTKSLHDSLEVSTHVNKSIVNINKLIEKNHTVYHNGLITKVEHDNNGHILWLKLVKKLQNICSPKVKKASKIDVYSLRAGINSLDNQN